MAEMTLDKEDISKVLCSDLPKTEEYASIIDKARESASYFNTDFEKFSKLDNELWFELTDLMARCIARGMRLAKKSLLDQESQGTQ